MSFEKRRRKKISRYQTPSGEKKKQKRQPQGSVAFPRATFVCWLQKRVRGYFDGRSVNWIQPHWQLCVSRHRQLPAWAERTSFLMFLFNFLITWSTHLPASFMPFPFYVNLKRDLPSAPCIVFLVCPTRFQYKCLVILLAWTAVWLIWTRSYGDVRRVQ